MASIVASSSLMGKTFMGQRVAQKSATKRVSMVKATMAQVEKAEVAITRRSSMALAAAAAVLTRAPNAQAAYGESANIWGRTTNKSGFIPYNGDGFAMLLPSKWNPSNEREFPGTELRYEDNFDAVSNLIVTVTKTAKSSIKDYGTPESFLNDVAFMLGQQTWSGKSKSEGGFKDGQVAKVAVVEVAEVDKKGKAYYTYELLSTTADGDEGGRHSLISATVSKGNLYVLKMQSGDKRWFKGQEKDMRPAFESFIVA